MKQQRLSLIGTLTLTLYTQGSTRTAPQSMTLLLKLLCAVEERLC